MSVIGSARLSGIHQSPAVDVRPSPLVSQDADRVPVDAPVRSGQEEEEEIFEIRDFTNASSFERLSHQISLASKHWAAASRAATTGASGASEEVLQMKDGFELGGFRYELLFQLVPIGETKKEDRLGLHAFPTRAHRLQRWFGVRHFLILSINNHNIDLDSARTLLSAAVLATAAVPLRPRLSCFVPVEGGRKRVLGEALHGRRTIYCTDLHSSVQPSLEHLAGLSDFFRRKVEAEVGDDKEPCTMMVGVRFTYSADHFDTWQVDGEEGEDAIESMKLHCLWPAFPLGAFVDDANFSELDPRSAPYWKLRLLRRSAGAAGGATAPRTARLEALLGFRREAKQIRSAEQSMHSQVPKTAMASLTAAIQESLESILLPTAGEMLSMTDLCMSLPVVPRRADLSATCDLGSAAGARRGGRLVQMAVLSAKMRCFKGAVMLWCSMLARMRRQWDALEAPSADSAMATTSRLDASARTELFDSSMCLAQQKMELLERSIRAKTSSAALSAPSARAAQGSFVSRNGRRNCVVPSLLCPALLTEDLRLQRQMAAAGLAEQSAERAELSLGKEMQADVAAFKAENMEADLEDFLQWREEIEGLSNGGFPRAWLEKLWEQTDPKLASEQQKRLFDPFRDAEMALHYLESIEGPQLLLQLFRVLLRNTLEELSDEMAEAGNPTYLRVLRDRVVSTSLQAFRWKSKEDQEEVDVQATLEELTEFPEEEDLQSILAAMEVLESSTRLAFSIRAKLGDHADGLLEDLLSEGEADVTQPDQRMAIENLFEQSRWLESQLDGPRSRAQLARARVQRPGQERLLGIFESLPLAKEFVLQLQPCETSNTHRMRRMYAEVRENHMRLALVRELSFS
ncbi:unnamed protein product [Durusdinium trenchii]|uniref:Rab3 GTPase-activating protein catalytic subunit n=1 Tax=Durusdinium trenchii TaxID=1381693 RepID=A0ABP0QMK3_9DINO